MQGRDTAHPWNKPAAGGTIGRLRRRIACRTGPPLPPALKMPLRLGTITGAAAEDGPGAGSPVCRRTHAHVDVRWWQVGSRRAMRRISHEGTCRCCQGCCQCGRHMHDHAPCMHADGIPCMHAWTCLENRLHGPFLHQGGGHRASRARLGGPLTPLRHCARHSVSGLLTPALHVFLLSKFLYAGNRQQRTEPQLSLSRSSHRYI